MFQFNRNTSVRFATGISIGMFLIYHLLFLFHGLLSPYFIMALGFCVMVIFVLLNRHFWRGEELLAFLLVLVIPTSFRMITGGDYGKLPLSWFNMVLIFLAALSLFRGMEKIDLFFLSGFFVFAVIHLFRSNWFVDSIKQIINVFAFLLAVPISKMVKKNVGRSFYSYCRIYYLAGVFSFALTVFAQYVSIRSYGITVGDYGQFANNRNCFGSLFSDYSFATLFLCSGIALFAHDIIYMKKHWVGKVLLCLVMFAASLLVNARTGLVALILAAALWVALEILKNKGRFAFWGVLGCVLAPVALMIMMRGRGGQSLFNSSGRGSSYLIGIKAFLQDPLFGSGLGLLSYLRRYQTVVPHNILIQYLAQSGITGFVLLCSYVVLWWKRFVSMESPVFLSLFTIWIGSLFIPDIFNSRFLIAIILLQTVYHPRSTLENTR